MKRSGYPNKTRDSINLDNKSKNWYINENTSLFKAA